MESIKKMPLNKCRICLGEYDESSMRALFTDNAEDGVDNDTPAETEEEADDEDAASRPRLNSEIEFCCGIRASRKLSISPLPISHL